MYQLGFSTLARKRAESSYFRVLQTLASLQRWRLFNAGVSSTLVLLPAAQCSHCALPGSDSTHHMGSRNMELDEFSYKYGIAATRACRQF
jgi:hypothetical protein